MLTLEQAYAHEYGVREERTPEQPKTCYFAGALSWKDSGFRDKVKRTCDRRFGCQDLSSAL
jgi:hypothetical protein